MLLPQSPFTCSSFTHSLQTSPSCVMMPASHSWKPVALLSNNGGILTTSLQSAATSLARVLPAVPSASLPPFSHSTSNQTEAAVSTCPAHRSFQGPYISLIQVTRLSPSGNCLTSLLTLPPLSSAVRPVPCTGLLRPLSLGGSLHASSFQVSSGSLICLKCCCRSHISRSLDCPHPTQVREYPMLLSFFLYFPSAYHLPKSCIICSLHYYGQSLSSSAGFLTLWGQRFLSILFIISSAQGKVYLLNEWIPNVILILPLS